LNGDTSHFVALRVSYEHKGNTYSTETMVSHYALLNNFIKSLKDMNTNDKWLVDPEAKATVVFLHGGGTTTASSAAALRMANHFPQLAIDTISFDFPLHGQGTRELHGKNGFIDDVEALGSFLKQYVPPDMPIYIYGHSWGGFFVDAMMRLLSKGVLNKETFIPQLKGLVNASGPTPILGSSIDEMIQNFIKKEAEARKLSDTQAPDQEQSLVANLAREGKIGFLQEFYIITQWLQRSMMDTKDFNQEVTVPYHVVMGKSDPNVYLARENDFSASYQDLVGLPLNLFKVYLFDKLFYKGEELIEVGHLLSDYSLFESDRYKKTGLNIEHEVLENLILETKARQVGLIRSSEKTPETLEELRLESIENLKNPRPELEQMRQALINDHNNIRSNIPNRLREDLGFNLKEARQKAIPIQKTLKALELFSDNISFRTWLDRFNTHVSRKNNTLGEKFLDEENGLATQNLKEVNDLAQKYHPKKILYDKLEILARMSPQDVNRIEYETNISPQLINNPFVDQRIQKIINSLIEKSPSHTEAMVSKDLESVTEDFITEVREIIFQIYIRNHRNKPSPSMIENKLSSSREEFEEFLNHYPYPSENLNNAYALPQKTKNKIMKFFEFYQDPSKEEFKINLSRDIHSLLADEHPYFQVHQILQKIYRKKHQFSIDSNFQNNFSKLEKVAQNAFFEHAIDLQLNSVLEGLHSLAEKTSIDEVPVELEQTIYSLLEKTKDFFPVKRDSFYLKQFKKKMNRDEFEEAINLEILPQMIHSDFINRFATERTNESSNEPFLRELKNHAHKPYELNQILQTFVFHQTYLDQLKNLSGFFDGKIKQDLTHLISDLERKNGKEEDSIIGFMLEYYLKAPPIRTNIHLLNKYMDRIRDSYPPEISGKLLSSIEYQNQLHRYQEALDIPTIEDFYKEASPQKEKNDKQDEIFKTRMDSIKELVASIKPKTVELRVLKSKENEKIRKVTHLIKEVSSHIRKIKSFIENQASLFNPIKEESDNVEKVLDKVLKNLSEEAASVVKRLEEQEIDLNIEALAEVFKTQPLSNVIDQSDHKVQQYKTAFENLNTNIIDRLLEGEFGSDLQSSARVLFAKGDEAEYNKVNSLTVHIKELSDLEREIIYVNEEIANLKEDYYKIHPFGIFYTSHALNSKDVFYSEDFKTSEELLHYLSNHSYSIKEIVDIWNGFEAQHHPELTSKSLNF